MILPAAAAALPLLLLLSPRVPSRSIGQINRSRLLSTLNDKANLLTSTKSGTVKAFQALLAKRQVRRDQNATIVEGPKMVFDLLKDRRTRDLVQLVLISVDHWDDYYERLLEAFYDGSVPAPGSIDPQSIDTQRLPFSVLPAEPHVLKACTDVVTPQGIVAHVSLPQLRFPILSDQSGTAPLYLVADGLQDPGNLGTLVRAGCAAGAAALLVPSSGSTCDPWSPKAVRAAMGTTFLGRPAILTAPRNWRECRELLTQQLGCTRILAATMLPEGDGSSSRRRSRPYFDIDYTSEPTAVVLGSEGRGLSREVQDDLMSGDGLVEAIHLPMQAGVESLNAAVCGSVILYEYVRQRTAKERLAEDSQS